VGTRLVCLLDPCRLGAAGGGVGRCDGERLMWVTQGCWEVQERAGHA
jgi:hypothetical protein